MFDIYILFIVVMIKYISSYFHIVLLDWFFYSLLPFELFFILFIVFYKKYRQIKYDFVAKILFIIFVMNIINTFIKSKNIILLLQSFIVFLDYLLIYIVFYNQNLFKKRQNKEKIKKWTLLILFLLLLFPFQYFRSTSRLSGLLGNPNLTAHFSLLILPYLLWLFQRNILLKIFILFFEFLIIILTGSRSSLLAFSIFSFFLLIIKYQKLTLLKSIFILFFTIFMTILIVNLAPIFIKNLDLFSTTRFSYVGDNHRYLLWAEALSSWKHLFFGEGIGLKLNFGDKLLGFHSTFIMILVSQGIIGFLFFTILIFLFIKKNKDNGILYKYQLLQLVVLLSLSYSATLFFIMSFHFIIIFLFQTKTNNIKGNI